MNTRPTREIQSSVLYQINWLAMAYDPGSDPGITPFQRIVLELDELEDLGVDILYLMPPCYADD